MTSMHYADTAHSIAAGLLLCAVAYAITQVARTDETRLYELTNHDLVIANMTADLRYFRMCPEQAAMLAEQTADFGVLGLMTTVAAVGIGTESATGRDRFNRVAFDRAMNQKPFVAAHE